MKKIFSFLIAAIALLVFAGTTLAAKPADNLAGAVKIPWNLSAAVMPVPPYGSFDLPGSDTASKLIVNQPNGAVQAVLNGEMRGLDPNTTYTVFISKGYTPYKETGWNVTGGYTMDLLYLNKHYVYTLTLNQSGTAITGSLNDSYLPTPEDLTIINGTINGDTLTFSVDYGSGSIQGIRTFTGNIDSSGAINGTWDEDGSENGSDVWSIAAGNATMAYTGDKNWPGLFNTQKTFTFSTNANGSGNWHLNLRSADLPEGTSNISVWINSGGTMLISDSFRITK